MLYPLYPFLQPAGRKIISVRRSDPQRRAAPITQIYVTVYATPNRKCIYSCNPNDKSAPSPCWPFMYIFARWSLAVDVSTNDVSPSAKHIYTHTYIYLCMKPYAQQHTHRHTRPHPRTQTRARAQSSRGPENKQKINQLQVRARSRGRRFSSVVAADTDADIYRKRTAEKYNNNSTTQWEYVYLNQQNARARPQCGQNICFSATVRPTTPERQHINTSPSSSA